jgi:hypothetical protein
MTDPISIHGVPPHVGLPDWTRRQQGQRQAKSGHGGKRDQDRPASGGESLGDQVASPAQPEQTEVNQGSETAAPAAGSSVDVGGQVDCEA